MLATETIQRKKIHRGPTVFRGIGADAKKLRVTRVHLWFVLIGERESPKLLERYRALHPEFTGPNPTKTNGQSRAERRAA